MRDDTPGGETSVGVTTHSPLVSACVSCRKENGRGKHRAELQPHVTGTLSTMRRKRGGKSRQTLDTVVSAILDSHKELDAVAPGIGNSEGKEEAARLAAAV